MSLAFVQRALMERVATRLKEEFWTLEPVQEVKNKTKGYSLRNSLNSKIMTTKNIVTLLCLCFSMHLNAQKLPDHQSLSVVSPAIKIDGIANEWDNKFEAYNKATSLFYTISNNVENLYFTIQARDRAIIDKIIGGGITLTFTSPKSVKEKKIATITFSALSISSRMSIGLSRNDTSAANIAKVNKELASATKEIKLAGLFSLQDTLLSIYNNVGIMAAARLTDYHTYTYELCVPIKYISPFIDRKSKLSYKVQVNGVNSNNMAVIVNGKTQQTPSEETMAIINSLLTSDVSSKGSLSLRDFTSPTNFSGEYTLAK